MTKTALEKANYSTSVLYTYDQAYKASLEYFKGDALAANVFVTKYALQDGKNGFLELTPDDMHQRLAREFARIEQKYPNPMSYEEIYNLFKNYDEVVAQGSPQSAIGNPFKVQSTSNCFAPGTLVLTTKGVKAIEEVRIGDEVVTHTGHLRKVVQTHKNQLADRQLFNIKAFRSPHITVTDNHKFWSVTQEQLDWGEGPQWNSVEKLRVGDWIAIPNNREAINTEDIFDVSSVLDELDFEGSSIDYKFDVGPEQITMVSHYAWTSRAGNSIDSQRESIPVNRYWKIDSNFARFLGLWFGDGCVFSATKGSSKVRGITFTFGAHEKALIGFVQEYGQQLFGLNPDVNAHNAEVDGTVQIAFHSGLVGRVFSHLWGRGYATKRLHSTMYGWDKTRVESLLVGLVESDGTVTGDGDVRIVMGNTEVIDGLYHLVRSFGIPVGRSVSEVVYNSEKRQYARLDLPKYSYLLDRIQKHYDDDRIERARLKPESKSRIREIDGTTFVRLDKKTKSVEKHDYVYTFGVEEDHSYSVQGLVAQNCFVVKSPFDAYSGILLTDQEQVQLMKRRGGVGFDISTIRPKGLPTANAANTTDGIEVFMDRFSNSCREVAQGGRRGALMLTLSVHHPQVRDFINIKKNRTRVTGANISLRLSDEFMRAVDAGEDYQLRWPVDSKEPVVSEMVSAREIWDMINQAAWESAEPGLLFWDTAKNMTPSDIYTDYGFASTSTNPCIVGDTLIAVADGRNAVSIRQLVEEGKDIPVYSTNTETGKVEIKWGRNPRLTKKNAEVWKLLLDDGSYLIATPDHKIMKSDCSYVELKDLQSGDSVFPFYTFDSNGYRQVRNTGEKMIGGARRNRRQYRLIHEFFNGPVNAKEFAIHHADFDSKNDQVSNLEVMTHEAHRNLHAEKMKGERNPYYRMSDDWKFSFASHKGEKNPKYTGHTNEEILDQGKRLFEKHGKLTYNLWVDFAKENGYPQTLANDFRFGTWKNFVHQVVNNHKVVSVEKYGVEDVYNITVDDNHNYHVITSTEDDKYITSSGLCVKNCGEIVLSDYDSCRLMLLNVTTFVEHPFTSKAKFNFKRYVESVIKAQRLMDDMIDIELEQVDKILAKIEVDPEPDYVKEIERNLWLKIRQAAVNGRRTGLGITGLGDAVAMMNLVYGKEGSFEFVEDVYKHLAIGSHTSSIIMAKERGAFPVFNYDLEKDHVYMKRIIDALPEDIQKLYKKHGRRNIANTTTAPCGSISTQTQTTSGIEPAYLIHYTRRKKINPSEADAKVDFVDELGDKWQHFHVLHHGFEQWCVATGRDPKVVAQALYEGDTSALKASPYYEATSNDISWVNKVRIQGLAQKWIDHAISNTTNLPKDVTVDVVKQVYMEGWKSGCKGVTVYRDGCRDGVLVSDTSAPKVEDNGFEEHDAPRRPLELDCEVHRTRVRHGDDYVDWTIFVGLLDGKPYEIFGGMSEFIELSNKIESGWIVKRTLKSGARYDFHYGDKEEPSVIRDIVKTFDNPNHGVFTRMLSLSLRHGAAVHHVIEQLQRDKDSDLFSFSKVMARVLKKYVKDGTKSSIRTCPDCGSEGTLVYQEGCVTCTACGSSKCG